jgi:multiple sugar transport system substrate-binding protein
MAISILLWCAGCGSKQPAEREVSFWAYATGDQVRTQLIESLVNKYNQEHPGTRIKLFLVSKNDFNTKINTSIAVGANPDCSYLDSGLVSRFAKDNILLCLDEFVNSGDLDLKDFYPGAMKMVKYEQKYYGIPLNQTCVAFFYNKELVKKAPATWDELLQTAKEVYVPGKIAAFAVPKGDGYGSWMFPAFVASAGGTMLNDTETKATFNQPPGLDAMNLWVQLLEYSPRLITDSANAFELGRVAMSLIGPWAIEGIKTNFPKLKYGIALIPKKVQYATNIGGESLVIYQNTKDPPAAWDFIRYLMLDENQVVMSEVTGNFPVKKTLINHPVFKDDPDKKIFMEQIQYAVSKPTVESWTKINDEIIAKAIDESLNKRLSIAEAFNKAAKDCDAVLAEEKQ